ncbi:MAG: hypothetical protein ACUVR6_04460, partial [Anaerolineae bacterium]
MTGALHNCCGALVGKDLQVRRDGLLDGDDPVDGRRRVQDGPASDLSEVLLSLRMTGVLIGGFVFQWRQ